MKLLIALALVGCNERPAYKPPKLPIAFAASEAGGIVTIQGASKPYASVTCDVPPSLPLRVTADKAGDFACKLPAPGGSAATYRVVVRGGELVDSQNEVEHAITRDVPPLQLVREVAEPPRSSFSCGGVVELPTGKVVELAGRLGYTLNPDGMVTLGVRAATAGTLELGGTAVELAANRDVDVRFRASDFMAAIPTASLAEKSRACSIDFLMRDKPPFDRAKCEVVVVPFVATLGSTKLTGHVGCDALLVARVLDRVVDGPLPFMAPRAPGVVTPATAVMQIDRHYSSIHSRGPTVPLAEVDAVVVARTESQQFPPCSYKNTKTGAELTVPRTALDLQVRVYDPRTGIVSAMHSWRAKEPDCVTSMRANNVRDHLYTDVEDDVAWPWLDSVIPRQHTPR